MAVSERTPPVGAYLEAGNATGVGASQGDNSVPHAGAAYLFARTGTTWSPQAQLEASNTGAGGLFGGLPAVSPNALAVGALHEDSGASGVRPPAHR